MSVHKHFQNASAWIAKAPPIIKSDTKRLTAAVVLRFPTERIRQGRDIGLAGDGKVLRPASSQAWRWRIRRGGSRHAG